MNENPQSDEEGTTTESEGARALREIAEIQARNPLGPLPTFFDARIHPKTPEQWEWLRKETERADREVEEQRLRREAEEQAKNKNVE